MQLLPKIRLIQVKVINLINKIQLGNNVDDVLILVTEIRNVKQI